MMQAYRKSRVVRALTAMVSIAFFGLCAGGALVLIGAPVARLIAPDNREWEWGLPVPLTVRDSAAVSTSWGPAHLSLEDLRGSIKLPIAQLPWSVFVLLWAHTAMGGALLLLLLHHLRRIFQRVRDGAPFDAQNALRLRWVGLLLLIFALFNGFSEFVTAHALRRGLSSGTIAIRTGLHFDLQLVFVSLALIALGEVFRRGTELETEQSLVI
jgi:DUF2975 family protein